MKDHKKVPSPQILIEIKSKGKGDRTSFRGRHESLNDEHHQHEGQPHGGKWKKFKGRGSQEAMVKVNKVDNQTTTQTIITTKNVGTW
jgi:hypothetical protein